MPKKKFYAVFSGSKIGVFSKEAEAQKYAADLTRKSIRSYKTEEAAYSALKSLCKDAVIEETKQKKSKFFLVFQGTKPGIYPSIEEARKHSRTTGKSSIKEYQSGEEADKAWKRLTKKGKIVQIPGDTVFLSVPEQKDGLPAATEKIEDFIAVHRTEQPATNLELLEADKELGQKSVLPECCLGHGHAYIDGSFSPKTGKYGYGVVLHYTGSSCGEVEFYGSQSDPSDQLLKSAAGEVVAAKAAIAKAVSLGLASVTVYHDFDSLASWADFPANNKTGKSQKEYATYIDRMRKIIHIEFVKVPAHSGLLLNDRAHTLARRAALGEE